MDSITKLIKGGFGRAQTYEMLSERSLIKELFIFWLDYVKASVIFEVLLGFFYFHILDVNMIK